MQFALWQPKIYTCSPVGNDIKKLISDPDILWAILIQKYPEMAIIVLYPLGLHALLAI